MENRTTSIVYSAGEGVIGIVICSLSRTLKEVKNCHATKCSKYSIQTVQGLLFDNGGSDL